jgi:NADPH:quinone reductase-like Zn-dependent oxidoreductase
MINLTLNAPFVTLKLTIASTSMQVGTTLRSRTLEYKGELVAELVKNVLPHFKSGKIRVAVDTVPPLSAFHLTPLSRHGHHQSYIKSSTC